MSLAAERVYGEVDVNPTEVGLGYTDLLAASASVLALIVAPFTLAVFAAFRFPGRGGRLWVRYKHTSRALLIILGIVYSGMFAWVFAIRDAGNTRDELLAGKESTALGPWNFTPASIAWLEDASTRPELPDCALLLGRADGIAVLYDPARERTLRLPATSLQIVADTRRSEC